MWNLIHFIWQVAALLGGMVVVAFELSFFVYVLDMIVHPERH